jgi:hypothetical protein
MVLSLLAGTGPATEPGCDGPGDQTDQPAAQPRANRGEEPVSVGRRQVTREGVAAVGDQGRPPLDLLGGKASRGWNGGGGFVG